MKKAKTTLRLFGLIFILMLSFSGCKRDSLLFCREDSISDCSEDPYKTNLRIKNNSTYNFCNLILDPSLKKVRCGSIKKGKTTCYRSFDKAYRYAYIQFYIGDKEFSFQPLDYTGETPLGIGKFTYILDITDYDSGKFSIKVQKD